MLNKTKHHQKKKKKKGDASKGAVSTISNKNKKYSDCHGTKLG